MLIATNAWCHGEYSYFPWKAHAVGEEVDPQDEMLEEVDAFNLDNMMDMAEEEH